jgi:hypothetical protein
MHLLGRVPCRCHALRRLVQPMPRASSFSPSSYSALSVGVVHGARMMSTHDEHQGSTQPESEDKQKSSRVTNPKRWSGMKKVQSVGQSWAARRVDRRDGVASREWGDKHYERNMYDKPAFRPWPKKQAFEQPPDLELAKTNKSGYTPLPPPFAICCLLFPLPLSADSVSREWAIGPISF